MWIPMGGIYVVLARLISSSGRIVDAEASATRT